MKSIASIIGHSGWFPLASFAQPLARIEVAGGVKVAKPLLAQLLAEEMLPLPRVLPLQTWYLGQEPALQVAGVSAVPPLAEAHLGWWYPTQFRLPFLR